MKELKKNGLPIKDVKKEEFHLLTTVSAKNVAGGSERGI